MILSLVSDQECKPEDSGLALAMLARFMCLKIRKICPLRNKISAMANVLVRMV